MSPLRLKLSTVLMSALILLLAALPALAEDGAAAPAPAEAQPDLYVAIMELHMPEGEPSPEQLAAMGGHIAHLKELYDSGVLVLAGPFDDESSQGMSVLRAGSLEAAREICAADPTVQAGIMEIIAVHPWWDAYNAWEGRSLTVEEFIQMMSPPADEAATSAASS
ncbi:hypothetical protein IT575_02320 [bacterium]|nr:hypothetical protein [bacterium]